MAITFFNPADPLALAGWEVQSNNPSTSYERAATLGPDGDEQASTLYGGRTSITLNYKLAQTGDGPITIPAVGTTNDGWHIDSVTLNLTASDYPTLDVSAHKHVDGTSHDKAHRTYSIPEAIAATLKPQFGIPAGAAGLTFGASLADGFSSITLALTANHVEADLVGYTPAVPASDNHDGTLTVTAEVIGDGTPTVASGIKYDTTETSKTTSNSSGCTSSNTYVIHLKHD